MSPFPLPARTLRRLLHLTATLGLVAALLGAVVGWTLLGRAQSALDESLALTADTLAALDASAGVAADSVDALAASLSAVETTAESLDIAFDDGEELLEELAVLVRRDVAEAIGAVDDALPGLIQVGSTIDTTLSALSTLPFGPDYDPDESFADALRSLSASLEGLPDRLVEQAALIEQTGENLGDVGGGVSALVAQLGSFDDALAETSALLDTYDETIEEGTTLVTQASDDLGGQLLLGRIAVVLFSVAFALLMIVPLQMAATAGTVRGSAPDGVATTE